MQITTEQTRLVAHLLAVAIVKVFKPVEAEDTTKVVAEAKAVLADVGKERAHAGLVVADDALARARAGLRVLLAAAPGHEAA